MNLNKLIDKYNDIEEAILQRFGYEQDWHVVPFADYRDVWWYISNDYEVKWFDEKPTIDSILETKETCEYSNEIISKNICRADNLCMIFVDTNTDGNQFLQIFDCNNEITGELLETIKKI